MKMVTDTRFWVNIVSLEHVEKNTAGGFIQSSRDGRESLEALTRGDYTVFYSPRTKFRKGKPFQKFTAIGMVQDGEPYRVAGGMQEVWRCHMEFLEAEPTPIEPLVNDLTFIPDKERWGLPFRKDLFEIERDDFLRIAQAMGVSEGC